jgi:hypothetical protein
MAWGRGAKAEAAPAYITKVSAEGLAAIIREAGFKAVVEQGKDGFPYILSASNGWNYIIRFFNKVGDDYATFQFTLWLKDKDSRISLARMNEFNARWRFVKGFLDTSDKSLSVQMDFDLEGGVSPAYLASRITHWDALIGKFRSFMAPDIA